MVGRPRSIVSPLDPRKSGLPDLRRLTADLGQARDRCLATLARDTRDRRHAKRTVGRSLVSRCQTAQSSSFPRRVPASGFVFPLRTRLSPVLRRRTRCNLATPAIPFHPERGVDGAPTGHSFVLSRVRGATSEPCGAACPVANGTSLGAPPWRFSAGDRCRRLRECKDRNRQRLVRKPQGLAEGSLTSRGSGSRRNRGTPLPAPPSGSSPETPLMSEDVNL